MSTIYEQIRELMSEAERRHAEIDREFEAKLQALIGRSDERATPAAAVPVPPTFRREEAADDLGTLRTFPGIHGAVVTVPTTENGRARKGAVQKAVRQILADGANYKLIDLAAKLGRSRNATFAVLKRMTYEGEVEPQGNGIYRGTPKLIEAVTGQEAMQTDT